MVKVITSGSGKPGWLAEQLVSASDQVAAWPAWMRRSSNIDSPESQETIDRQAVLKVIYDVFDFTFKGEGGSTRYFDFMENRGLAEKVYDSEKRKMIVVKHPPDIFELFISLGFTKQEVLTSLQNKENVIVNKE